MNHVESVQAIFQCLYCAAERLTESRKKSTFQIRPEVSHALEIMVGHMCKQLLYDFVNLEG